MRRNHRDEGGRVTPRGLAWLIIAGLVAFMLLSRPVVATMTTRSGGGDSDLPQNGRQGRGRAQPGRLGRLRRGRHRPTRRSTGSRRFEKQTGCKVNVKVGDTSDEMVQLMRTGQYDGVSASGNASARLIEGGDVAPVNTDLVPTTRTSSPV